MGQPFESLSSQVGGRKGGWGAGRKGKNRKKEGNAAMKVQQSVPSESQQHPLLHPTKRNNERRYSPAVPYRQCHPWTITRKCTTPHYPYSHTTATTTTDGAVARHGPPVPAEKRTADKNKSAQPRAGRRRQPRTDRRRRTRLHYMEDCRPHTQDGDFRKERRPHCVEDGGCWKNAGRTHPQPRTPRRDYGLGWSFGLGFSTGLGGVVMSKEFM